FRGEVPLRAPERLSENCVPLVPHNLEQGRGVPTPRFGSIPSVKALTSNLHPPLAVNRPHLPFYERGKTLREDLESSSDPLPVALSHRSPSMGISPTTSHTCVPPALRSSS